jgi:hypothetical protein
MSCAANAIFNQVDANADGVIDQGEFNQFVSGASYGSGLGYGYGAGYGYGGWSGANNYGYNLGYNGLGNFYGGYAGYDASAAAGVDASYVVSGGNAFDASSAAFSSGVVASQYQADASGNFVDSAPEIIRRPAAQGVQTYTQNVAVRFLQPPPVPPPGPLIIKEVRPPQPPPPAPLRLRQQAPPLPTPPPLVLRERPPQPPALIPSQTVIRRLPAIPVPPRSVILERLPPLPPKPRDIVLERWLPYGPRPPRRTLLQRAGPAVQYPRPRNVIIQYDQVPARVVRQVHRLGVTQANPSAYVGTYGASLLDSVSLLSQARAAGVVEDISAPGVAYGYNAATYGQDLSGYASWGGLEGAGWNQGGWYGAGYSGLGWNGGVVDAGTYNLGSNAWYGWNGGSGYTTSACESGVVDAGVESYVESA